MKLVIGHEFLLLVYPLLFSPKSRRNKFWRPTQLSYCLKTQLSYCFLQNVLVWILANCSVIYAYEKYHPQTFLEECKYAKEKIKTDNYINEELKSQSDSVSDIDIEE